MNAIFETLELYLSAYLLLHGITPTLEVVNKRVVFRFQHSEELYQALADYNANTPVPVADYVVLVKALRGRMLSLRGTQQ